MGLKCRISYREGEVVVRKENGELSDLYYELLDYAKSSSIALDMWATAHSREMGEIGEDATVDEIVKYFDSAVAAKESLSPSEKMQVKDFMRRNGIESLDQLNKILAESFKPNGVFEINPIVAVNSGLFTQDELLELDPLTLQNLLLKIEGHLINDNFSVEPETQRDFYKDTTSKTIFGTYDRVSQEEVDAAIRSKIETFDNIEDFYEKIKELPYEDFVTRFSEDDEFANTIISHFSSLKRIPKLSIINGKLSKDNNKTYTTVKNTVLAGQNTTKVEAEIDYLNSIDPEVWDSNPELIRQVLKEVEQEFIDLNVDVIGISEFPARRSEVMAIIESATQMLNSVTEENIKIFSDNLSNLLSVQDTVVVENIPSEYTGYNIVSLHTEIPENELFDTYGLIKVGDNLFHKVDQRANSVDLIDFIYGEILDKRLSIPSEYMITKDLLDKPSVLTDISRYLMSRNTIQGINDKELYSAYQVIFGHNPLPSKINEARELAVIKTDENYLKTSFVSDFYNYILKEKAANTSTYKTILSKFEITDRDITLTDTIPSIEGIEFQQELSDYIRLQKDSNMKYLVEPTTEIVSEDLLYTNFPEAKTEYEGDFVKLGDYIITPTTSDNYIKVNNELYRRGLDRENGRLFVKVPQRGDSKYYTRNLNFEFNRLEASQVFDKYTSIDKNSVDYSTFKSVISRSRIEDDMNVNLKEFSTLKDKSYTFAQVNNAIVAFKDGMRVGSIRYTKTTDGYAIRELTVSEIHRGKGIATELYLKMFDKILKEGKVFYPSEVRTQAAQNVFSRLEGLLIPTPSGGFMVSDSIQMPRFQVDAWHGSPYKFEKFTTEAIGTGEGAQAFGWGLYFTDLEGIARNYAAALSKPTFKELFAAVQATEMSDLSKNDILDFSEYYDYNYEKTLDKIKSTDNLEAIKFLEDNKSLYESKMRNLYKVSLHQGKTPDQYNWLVWDKELNKKQIQDLLDNDIDGSIAEALTNHYTESYDITTTNDLIDTIYNSDVTGRELYKILERNIGEDPSPKAASIALLNAGIDGIKYPAESVSRGATSDTARGFNYVVFDENAVEIQEAILFSQPSDIVKEAQIVPREAFEIVATRLSENGLLKGNLIVNKQGFAQGLRIANKENRSSASPNEVAGFVLGEDVFINPDSLNYNTPIHEYGHLWAKWARDFRPDLYNRGIELVRDSEYYEDIVARSKDKNSVYFEYAEDKILEEALVTAIGNQGESFVNKTKFDSFQQFLTDLWASIKEALGLTQISPEQLSNLTLDQFTEAVAIDLLKGGEIYVEVSERRSPAKDIENVSSIFDSRLELLDLYSSKEEAGIIKDINDCGA